MKKDFGKIVKSDKQTDSKCNFKLLFKKLWKKFFVGKYYKTAIGVHVISAVIILGLIIGSVFAFAGLRYCGCVTENEAATEQPEQTEQKQQPEQTEKLKYWGEVIEFLPDTIGGFVGIIVGFFFEATLFKAIKDRKQRYALFVLLEEELQPIVANRIIAIIPTTESILSSVEFSRLLNFEIKPKVDKKEKQDKKPKTSNAKKDIAKSENLLTILYNILNAWTIKNDESKTKYTKKTKKEANDELIAQSKVFLGLICKD